MASQGDVLARGSRVSHAGYRDGIRNRRTKGRKVICTVNGEYREGRNEANTNDATTRVASDKPGTGCRPIDSFGRETENREDKRKPKEQEVVTSRNSRVVKRRQEMRPKGSSRLVPLMGRICNRKWKASMRQQQRPVVGSVSSRRVRGEPHAMPGASLPNLGQHQPLVV
jgi:hypothetical protein